MRKRPELSVVDLPIGPVFGTPAAGLGMMVFPVPTDEKGRMSCEKPDPAPAV
jgi:hypothetical protein